jgi:uncharacterized protein GlcG (DUF336 family)
MERSFSKTSIAFPMAEAMVRAAQGRARELKLSVAVAIVDESGMLKAFGRMDGAPQISVSASQKKALTAVGFGLATGEEWYRFMKDDPILAGGAAHLDNFILLGGGMPIRIDGEIVGAIGVSGGHYAMDEQCARAALELFEAEAAR